MDTELINKISPSDKWVEAVNTIPEELQNLLMKVGINTINKQNNSDLFEEIKKYTTLEKLESMYKCIPEKDRETLLKLIN